MCVRVTVVTFPAEATGTEGLFAHSIVMRMNTSEATCPLPLPRRHSGRAHEHLYLAECDAFILQRSRRENKVLNINHSTSTIFDIGFVVASLYIKGGSNMTGTDLYVNKPHCAAAVRP